MERTLLIIKPDGVKRKLIGKIISRIEEKGFDILAIKSLKLTIKEAKEFYKIHKGKDFYPSLCRFMASGPIVVILLAGKDSQRRLRELVGDTDPKKAKKGTIRGDFGTSIQKNVVHAANPKEDVEREIKFFF
ncbi:MAG: nucleoside-diphosphate kinase [candidate division WOR-3 bacterium]|nr:nucleoside-diphosphate kinase [candidate division WOR-3 bacterium]MCX7837231.1 nucleoside-diphosphate kinase [candidate division WOR-3 bacterium]MDW8113434.1 nucleoside-diphosphate kinase [candidate division WOR-3 bacterium]